jgi:hypothetical protein
MRRARNHGPFHLFIALRERRGGGERLEKKMPYGLRITFLVHVFVAGIFGVVLLLIPETYASMTAFPVSPGGVGLSRLIGAIFVAIATSSWLAYKETIWDRVKILVQMEIALTILGALAMVWGLLSGGFPVAYWMNAAIFVVFAIAFITFYSRN